MKLPLREAGDAGGLANQSANCRSHGRPEGGPHRRLH
jgi:hypothetical protein